LWDRVAGNKEELKVEAAGRGGSVRVHFQRNSGMLGSRYLGEQRDKNKVVVEGVVVVLGLR
jgi:hypothetical protein